MPSLVLALLTALALAAPPAAGTPVAAPASASASPGEETIDVSTYPPEQQVRYLLFERKCSKCHSLSMALGSGDTLPRWKRYLAQMSRRPEAGLSEAQGQEILEFLRFYAARRGVE
ncbi:MAG TPA: hypothetical protein VML50_08495 [Anaeromyxobacter sp.]|nr:hypothetical protein [Anaeromyxobacter sp.]